MLCATAPLTPAASSSVREARITACGVRNRAISLPAFRAPRPGNQPQRQPMKFFVLTNESCLHEELRWLDPPQILSRPMILRLDAVSAG